MLFVGIGVVIFLLTFVIPKVTQIFSDMGRALPVPTQILLAVSDGIRSGWWIILLLVLCFQPCPFVGSHRSVSCLAQVIHTIFPGILAGLPLALFVYPAIKHFSFIIESILLAVNGL